MSTGLNLGSPTPGAEELMTPSAETGAASVITAASTVDAKPIAPAARKLLPFGLVLSPEEGAASGHRFPGRPSRCQRHKLS